jgi:hypothetical protein
MPDRVSVNPGATTPGLDFTLGQAFLPASVSQQGFRRLDVTREVGR